MHHNSSSASNIFVQAQTEQFKSLDAAKYADRSSPEGALHASRLHTPSTSLPSSTLEPDVLTLSSHNSSGASNIFVCAQTEQFKRLEFLH